MFVLKKRKHYNRYTCIFIVSAASVLTLLIVWIIPIGIVGYEAGNYASQSTNANFLAGLGFFGFFIIWTFIVALVAMARFVFGGRK